MENARVRLIKLMSFPRKFAHLIEIKRGDVEVPDYLWLVYAVCALSSEGVVFGQNVIHARAGARLRVGDEVVAEP